MPVFPKQRTCAPRGMLPDAQQGQEATELFFSGLSFCKSQVQIILNCSYDDYSMVLKANPPELLR